MADGRNDDTVPVVTKQMRGVIAEEVGKAIENSLSGFIDKIQNTVLNVVEEQIQRLEENAKPSQGKWLSDIEGVFERTHCEVSDFVAYGTGQLRGQAKDWWDNKKKEIGADAAKAMTWDEFKAPFLKHHSPKAVINRIKEEFIQLRQKGESIDKIMGIFLDKLRFCDELEIELKKQIERGERRAVDVNPSPTKKALTTESIKKTDVKGGSPSCKVCGKGHKGECRFKDKPCPICGKTGHTAALCPGKVSVCYKCYQPGHKKSECPEVDGKRNEKDVQMEAQKARARSFQLTAAEVKIEPDVVSGKFLVNSILTQILFDTSVNSCIWAYMSSEKSELYK
ncbi:uncharacterized protein LOC118481810 [Helianthus annuus]|uniref:uncharacterized protein LOC118481810 n=1 Tax=Helianthus annuus TaxID=4232 RepID=UPI001652DE76|nr:uncharacterized protein LOC118481810 [Helianthus annuus]